MSLTAASSDLSQGVKTAAKAWDETRAVWDDAVAAEFEARYWVPLTDQTKAVVEALDRLAPVLARMVRECS